MNSSSTESSVPRILIVENEPGTVSNLKNKLEGAIPDVVVESAENVKDGQEKLDAAYDHHCPYDVAILDFKLPHDETSPTEVGDFSLGFLRDLCPDTLVIHMTAKPDDPDFQRVRPAPNTPAAANRLYFGKDEYDWAQKLVETCAKHIRGKDARRIRAEYEELFGGDEKSARGARSSGRRGSGPGDRSWGLKFAMFCNDAGAHWSELGEQDKDFQELLARNLGHTKDETGRHYVGVLMENEVSEDASPEESA